MAVGFDPKKAPVIVLPDAETMSQSVDSAPVSDQDPQATAVGYTQLHPGAMKAGQTGNKCCLDLTKPFSSLSLLAITCALCLPIDDTHVAWLDHFLTNTDIPDDVHPKHQQ